MEYGLSGNPVQASTGVVGLVDADCSAHRSVRHPADRVDLPVESKRADADLGRADVRKRRFRAACGSWLTIVDSDGPLSPIDGGDSCRFRVQSVARA